MSQGGIIGMVIGLVVLGVMVAVASYAWHKAA